MFIQERYEMMGKNEMYLSDIMEVFDQKYTSSFIGEKQGVLTVRSEENDANFSAIVNENTVAFFRINGTPCNLVIQVKDGCGRIVNKDLNLKFQYDTEDLDDSIKRISVIQEMNNNSLIQSYLYKNEDALLIGQYEKVDKHNLPKDMKADRDFSVLLENKNLINVSVEEMLEYADNMQLGLKAATKEQLDELGFIERDSDDDIDDDELLEDYIGENEEEEFDDFSDIVVKENGKELDKISSEEMINDIYDVLLNDDIYFNISTINSVEEVFESVKNIFKEQQKKNDEYNR